MCFKDNRSESVNLYSTEGDHSASFIRGSFQQLAERVGAIKAATSKIERHLQGYASELANLTEHLPKDDDFEV